ncbi:MAG: hypothetical protein U0132_12855 [Gemmatimonadaceae bacterium]
MPDTTVTTAWMPTGAVSPSALVSARLQVHHAAQLVVAAGISYLPAKPDDSHTNLEWLPAVGALAGNVLSPASGFRFGLRVADLSLLALGRGDQIIDALELSGHDLSAGDLWMRDALGQAGFEPGRLTQKKHYAIPAHPVAGGAAFDAPRAHLAELSRYFHDAWVLTTRVASERPEASVPRCWPHHFDLATLLTLPSGSDGSRRTIGVGISAGDGYYAEPYVYIGPYPYPPAAKLGALPFGHWHTDEWTGAVLTASEFSTPDGGERVLAFTHAAVAACERAFAS